VNDGPLVKKRYVHYLMGGWPLQKYVEPFFMGFRLRLRFWEMFFDYFDTSAKVLRFEFARIDDNRMTFRG